MHVTDVNMHVTGKISCQHGIDHVNMEHLFLMHDPTVPTTQYNGLCHVTVCDTVCVFVCVFVCLRTRRQKLRSASTATLASFRVLWGLAGAKSVPREPSMGMQG